jgi:hypothetical protein
MPKWKSILHRGEELLPNGARKDGIVAWIPVDDAAKASKLTEKAIELGAYKAAPGDREKMERKLKEREVEDLKKRGLIS